MAKTNVFGAAFFFFLMWGVIASIITTLAAKVTWLRIIGIIGFLISGGLLVWLVEREKKLRKEERRKRLNKRRS